jgi:hypothetical protein
MPLPQSQGSPGNAGYILKNFRYYEEITFSVIHGNAPNRGGDFTQNCQTLFYEQRVYLAEGPAKDQLIHAENGSWLYLERTQQSIGPYGEGGTIPNGNIPAQDPAGIIVKQMSVPHGISILARGSFQTNINLLRLDDLAKFLAPGTSAIPHVYGLDPRQYFATSQGNPYPNYNSDVYNSLTQFWELWTSQEERRSGTVFYLDTDGVGAPANINFESKRADVPRYQAAYQIVTNFGETYMMYRQQIDLVIPISGIEKPVSFPHTTCNVLSKVR